MTDASFFFESPPRPKVDKFSSDVTPAAAAARSGTPEPLWFLGHFSLRSLVILWSGE